MLRRKNKKLGIKRQLTERLFLKKQCASRHHIGPSFKMLFCSLKPCGSLNLKRKHVVLSENKNPTEQNILSVSGGTEEVS